MGKNENNTANTTKKTREDGVLTAQVIGRITADPEVKETERDGRMLKYCSNMSIVVNRYDSDTPTYVNLVLYDKEAERYAKFLKKGMKVFATGNLVVDVYKKDGNERQRLTLKNAAITKIFSGYSEKNKKTNEEEKEEAQPNIESDNDEEDFDRYVEIADLDEEDGLPF